MYCEFCGSGPKCGVCGRNDLARRPEERTARFWVLHLGSWVKLSLRPGDVLEHYDRAPADEGYQADWNKWELEAGVVSWEWSEDGRDCDGRYSRGGSLVCPVEDLAARTVESMPEWPACPEWQTADRYQRDHAAEAAGY